MRTRAGRRALVGLAVALVLTGAGCGATGPSPPDAAGPSPPPTTASSPSPVAEPEPPARPEWLGTRALPTRPDGLGEPQDTPAELVERQLPPPEQVRPVADTFQSTVGPVPEEVATRSTWRPECPVDLADLRYLTVTFRGFDGHSYPGELIVHRSVADDVVSVFDQLYEVGFPIEEMRVVDQPELSARPTGDGNNTSGFSCRATTLRESWSQHAYGLAIDINPFHNPYRRGPAVSPELATSYLDRGWDRPGMIQPGDPVTRAFAGVGWSWGGDWRSLDDWMHFSVSGQ